MAEAFIVVGLGFGDEGKGTIVDHLCREHDADRVIRFNGGAQASHAVVLPDGRSHCFHQFGSGTFAGASTHLSKYMMVNPAMIFDENADLLELGVQDALNRLSIHEHAPITTRFHVAANRLREISRGHNKHGSCGLGIGETMQDFLNGEAIFARDLLHPDLLKCKLSNLRIRKYLEFKDTATMRESAEDGDWPEEYKVLSPKLSPHEIDHLMDLYSILAECVEIRSDTPLDGTTVFEGAQGILLDQDLPASFQPYTTWSKTTMENALRICEDNNSFPHMTRIGALRAYATRHGAGPLPTFSERLTVALRDPHNPANEWQGGFRCGRLDLGLLKWAIAYSAIKPDFLAVTCLDQVSDPWRVRRSRPDLVSHLNVATSWSGISRQPLESDLALTAPEDLLRVIEHDLEVPVSIASYGPTHADKQVLISA